jgi:hypothetical protein
MTCPVSNQTPSLRKILSFTQPTNTPSLSPAMEPINTTPSQVLLRDTYEAPTTT